MSNNCDMPKAYGNFFHMFEFSTTHAALLSKCQGLLRHLP